MRIELPYKGKFTVENFFLGNIYQRIRRRVIQNKKTLIQLSFIKNYVTLFETTKRFLKKAEKKNSKWKWVDFEKKYIKMI
jgi:hypothetical protein